MILACKLNLYAYLTFKFDTVRVESLVFVVDTDKFVEKGGHLIGCWRTDGINTRVWGVIELRHELLKEILQRIAVGVDFQKSVGILFGGINGYQFTVLFPCDGFEFAIFAASQKDFRLVCFYLVFVHNK